MISTNSERTYIENVSNSNNETFHIRWTQGVAENLVLFSNVGTLIYDSLFNDDDLLKFLPAYRTIVNKQQPTECVRNIIRGIVESIRM